MAAADVVIGRAGAISISEITALGKASVLIPSPNVVHNHQYTNAKLLEEQGAAAVVTEDSLSGRRCKKKWKRCLTARIRWRGMGKTRKNSA